MNIYVRDTLNIEVLHAHETATKCSKSGRILVSTTGSWWDKQGGEKRPVIWTRALLRTMPCILPQEPLIIGVGFARCAKADNFCYQTGRNLAVKRALRWLASRAKTHNQRLGFGLTLVQHEGRPRLAIQNKHQTSILDQEGFYGLVGPVMNLQYGVALAHLPAAQTFLPEVPTTILWPFHPLPVAYCVSNHGENSMSPERNSLDSTQYQRN